MDFDSCQNQRFELKDFNDSFVIMLLTLKLCNVADESATRARSVFATLPQSVANTERVREWPTPQQMQCGEKMKLFVSNTC